MNNTQLYLSIGIPTLTVILAWISNKSDYNRLSERMDKLADTLRSEMNALATALRGEMTALRVDINRDMVAFRKEVHEDLILLHERVVKVETRQNM